MGALTDRSVTLTNGELPATRDKRGLVDKMGVFLGAVKYGDVTGDGVEEAIIYLSIQTGGSARPGLLYVYTLQQGRPKLLWHRSTGDRADGGLRAVYAPDGYLVVERNSAEGSQGACCPTRYTQISYQWRGGRFRVNRKETLRIPG
jgi:hypothetical protein